MIFVDTGAFLARYLARDQYHQRAVEGWRLLGRHRSVTTAHVLDEVFTLLGRRAGNAFAAEHPEAAWIFLKSLPEAKRTAAFAGMRKRALQVSTLEMAILAIVGTRR